MLIGTLSMRTGLPKDTIRYYQKLGLIQPASRREGGYREYSDDTVSTLTFIKNAKRLGFTLTEIKGLMDLCVDQSYTCENIQKLSISKMDQINREIAKLDHFKALLFKLKTSCDTDSLANLCPSVESLWQKQH